MGPIQSAALLVIFGYGEVPMQQLCGKAVSPGYARGTAFVYGQRRWDDVPRYRIAAEEVAHEHHRFHEAIVRSIREVEKLESRVLVELGEVQSAIFAAHLGLLRDQNFVQRVRARVQQDLINVEQALDAEVADLSATLASVDSEYLRERAQDIRDIGGRILRHLTTHEGGQYVDLPSQSVIIARELLPSETLDLDREHVVAIVTEEGGENSHAAILARALGIPSVTGITSATTQIRCGTAILVDGENGLVSVAPNETAIVDFRQLKSRYDADSSAASAAETLDCVTRDGTRVSLLANINRPREAALVAAHHLDGVGLFRTEFMFLETADPPSCERQIIAYRDIVDALPEHPVAVRTLDLGGDKIPAFLSPHYEANPHLGSRGLRFSLAENQLFRTQLRAIITAARDHRDFRLLLPMVLGASDLADATELINELASQLGCDAPQVGAMIETPAALFALEEIFQLADFVCIGTNDLTQFMLAADRDAFDLADDYSVLHPSVLRAIAQVAQLGESTGRPVSVCGEAASYPRTACLLVGLGIRQLSMSPLRAARVRYMLRSTRLADLEQLAQEAIRSRSVADVRQLLCNLPSHFDTSSSVGQTVTS